jgi:hypothetical protein
VPWPERTWTRRYREPPAHRFPLIVEALARLAKTIVLDFMQPLAAGWQFIGFDRKARRDEPGR